MYNIKPSECTFKDSDSFLRVWEIAEIKDHEMRQLAYRVWEASSKLNQDSLDKRIAARVGLEAWEVIDIVNVVCSGCNEKTKREVGSKLRYNLIGMGRLGIFERLMWDRAGGWSYCAGQDYRSELKALRKAILEA